jgi:tetratricopeptide (TPR) repeat protein
VIGRVLRRILRPPFHPPRVAVFAVAAALLLAAALSLARVPAGLLGVTAGRLLEEGWHLTPPFARPRLVPLQGRLEAIDVPRRSPEGASFLVRLSFDYRLDPAALRPHAVPLGAGGLRRVARDAAAAALAPLPAALLLPTVAPVSPGAATPLPEPALESAARGLRGAGIEPSGLVGRVGPEGAFAREETAAATRAAGDGATGGGTSGGGRGPMPERTATGVRLVFVGLDGADWDIIDPLLREGRLPHLARLVAAGARGPLRSYDPMISPLLWTTMVTGVGPDLHGVADFQAIDPATGRRVPISSRFRRVKSLWNILSDAGVPNAFVGWWASYPAEPVRGFQVSNLVAFDALRPREAGKSAPPGLTFPADYLAGVQSRMRHAGEIGWEEARGIVHVGREEFEAARREVLAPPAGDEGRENRRMAQRPVPLAVSILTGSDNYATIAADLAGRRLDLTAVYFEGIDMMGHRFQHCMPPRLAICPEEDFARFRDAVTGFYVRQDALLGRVLRAAGPEATTLVVSDHGFKSGDTRPPGVLPYTTEQPVEWHDEDGILVLSGPGARRGARLYRRATLFDIAPTILYLLGLPVAEEMPGRVLLEAIDPAFARAHPARSIRTYETLGNPREAVLATASGAGEAEEELLAHLRALGYIGGDAGGRDDGQAPGGTGAGGDAPGPASTDPPSAGGPVAETQVFYHRNLATYFLKRKDYARAAEQLRLANERQKLGKNYQLLAEARAGMGQPVEAIAALEEGLRELPAMDAESVLWGVQVALAGAGGKDAAAALARRHAGRTAAKPGLQDAIAGLLAEASGDRAGARDLLRRALAADPARVVVAQRLYALLPAAERTAILEPALRRALALDPRIDEYHNLLGVLDAGRGRGAAALASFRRAETIDPQNPRFVGNLASALAQMGRWEEAADAYERSAALAPSATTCMKLGSVYRRLGRPEEALRAFERARALGAADAAPYLGMALARAEMRDAPGALEVVREGLGRHPGDPSLRSLYEDLLRKTRTPGSAPGPPGSGR